jgi:hypothetical protein
MKYLMPGKLLQDFGKVWSGKVEGFRNLFYSYVSIGFILTGDIDNGPDAVPARI